MRKDANGNYFISKSIAFRDKASAAVTFTAFVRRGEGLFDVYEETVTEVSFPIDRVLASLHEIGFADVSVKNDMFEDVADPEQLDRAFVIYWKTKVR